MTNILMKKISGNKERYSIGLYAQEFSDTLISTVYDSWSVSKNVITEAEKKYQEIEGIHNKYENLSNKTTVDVDENVISTEVQTCKKLLDYLKEISDSDKSDANKTHEIHTTIFGFDKMMTSNNILYTGYDILSGIVDVEFVKSVAISIMTEWDKEYCNDKLDIIIPEKPSLCEIYQVILELDELLQQKYLTFHIVSDINEEDGTEYISVIFEELY